ncbi:MAG: hypothetical protein JW940_34605 [Polyangiaceae bacterium]|nr:hypothetical protein [Polyangiaceae bacterium]
MTGPHPSWWLALLLLLIGCGSDTRTGECAKIARTVNAQLDRIEAVYRAAPKEQVDWTQISAMYGALAAELKNRKTEDPRLVPMMSEYILLIDLASRNAMGVASAQKTGKPLEQPLAVLRQQAEQHARLSHRIDRTCRMQ